MSSPWLSPAVRTALARANHWHQLAAEEQVSLPCLCESRFAHSGFQPAEAKETPLLRALRKHGSGVMTACMPPSQHSNHKGMVPLRLRAHRATWNLPKRQLRTDRQEFGTVGD